jgi:hypothetical protein
MMPEAKHINRLATYMKTQTKSTKSENHLFIKFVMAP